MVVLMVIVIASLLQKTAATGPPSFSFVAVGDWGGNSDSDPAPKGQKDDASGMGKVASDLGASFVLALGDNFYGSGIHGDAHSSRFQSSFEDVYTASSLTHVPWYVISGNHDHLGNVSAQIAYSQISRRWNYPKNYYAVSKMFPDGGNNYTLDILMIDTVIFAGNSDLNEENGLDHWDQPLLEDQAAADSQFEWLKEKMASSTADYLIVAGHYPVWSACEHGPTSVLVSKVRPLLQQHRAHFMAGHDHCLEHIVEEGVQYSLVGAGKETSYKLSNIHKIPKDSLAFSRSGSDSPRNKIESGFGGVTFKSGFMTFSYFDESGNKLFSGNPIKSRN